MKLGSDINVLNKPPFLFTWWNRLGICANLLINGVAHWDIRFVKSQLLCSVEKGAEDGTVPSIVWRRSSLIFLKHKYSNYCVTAALQSSWKTISAALTFVDDDDDDDDCVMLWNTVTCIIVCCVTCWLEQVMSGCSDYWPLSTHFHLTVTWQLTL